ncbi:MAG: hypothetical protein AVDCRST_MAG41-147 [uncultured Corynebacteriales bacterium]|uniref:HTH luxR-type domain-containing protein n=1 Tax=uncultured Mycobacteriales bacterium TaxID=581187 RepID=A0A6J4H4F7_9ACTN|nr:MAG: hypothetical protein AVDCRST_MAG41-147 [uncultured Corynebacteriales bacterium]
MTVPRGVTRVPASSLTTREEQVRSLVVGGLGTDGVATQLGISRRTVETHLRNVYKKLGVHRRDQLADPDGDGDFLIAAPASEDEVERLREKLAERERQVESYEAAVERIIDRQFPLFEERVELTLSVGGRPNDDMVIERHWTKPKPYLVYRVIRPVAAAGLLYDEILDEMAISCEVASADVGIAVEVFSDQRGRPVALILFQPGLEEMTEWVLRYRTPHLWDPLREHGRDTLRWAPGRLRKRSSAGIRDLTVHFDFPETTVASVVEEHNLGRVEPGQSETPGMSRITYRDASRAGAQYEFTLEMVRGAERS